MDNTTKYIFIINPAAGKQTAQSALLRQIRATLPPDRYELKFTARAGDGTRIAADCVQKSQQMNQNIVLFACGGDGTFFEVINGAAGQVPVGVFPCGSGNDFVKNIIDADNLMDVAAQVSGKPVPLDLLRCNGQYVANVCNIGFDADIAYNMNQFRRLPFVSGKAAYLLATVYCFFRRMGYPMTIQIDDEAPVSGDYLFTVIANGQTYGGSFRGAPQASVHDGFIDVCLCKKISRLTLLRFVSAFQKGTYLQKPGIEQWIHYQKCKKITVTMPSATVTGYDGNITNTTQIETEIVPAAMQLIIPQGARLL